MPAKNSFQELEKRLIVIRNIPVSLSSNTLNNWFSSFGSILKFELVSSEVHPQKNEAVILFQNDTIVDTIVDSKIPCIGGFFIERFDHNAPVTELLLKRISQWATMEDNLGMANEISKTMKSDPISGDNLNSVNVPTAKDHNDMANQLITSYAQILATTFLTVESIGEYWGIFSLLDSVNHKFHAIERVNSILNYFKVFDTLSSVHHIGKKIKMKVAEKSIGKPVVDQYEELKRIGHEMFDRTKDIIDLEHRRVAD
ncbi:hypothetical protein BC833DRAFT_582653 [Globomyces pollinis-pini]|nr:hypothetical protein BC833DRAFT_582653 [Globomyces pollinis-pini]